VPEGFTFADALFDVGQGHFVFRARGEGSTGTLLSVSTTLPVYDTIIPPIASSPLATAILGRVSDFTLWSDLARTRVVLFAERSGTPSPYGFQDGTYVATLP